MNKANFFKSFLILSFSFLTFSASAADEEIGLTVEPYAGYFKGSIKGDGVDNGSLKSYMLGARLGYHAKVGFSGGIDYSQGKGTWELDATGSAKRDFNTKEIGAFVGYSFSEYLKFSASYMPIYDVDVTNATFSAFKGDGYNASIIIKLLKFFKIRATYSIRNLKEADGVSLTGSNNKTDTVFVSFSAPINFPYKFN